MFVNEHEEHPFFPSPRVAPATIGILHCVTTATPSRLHLSTNSFLVVLYEGIPCNLHPTLKYFLPIVSRNVMDDGVAGDARSFASGVDHYVLWTGIWSQGRRVDAEGMHLICRGREAAFMGNPGVQTPGITDLWSTNGLRAFWHGSPRGRKRKAEEGTQKMMWIMENTETQTAKR